MIQVDPVLSYGLVAAALKLGGGFADDAVINSGRIATADVPGIGFERKAEPYKAFRALPD